MASLEYSQDSVLRAVQPLCRALYCLHLYPFEEPHIAQLCGCIAWERCIFKNLGATPVTSFGYIRSFRSTVNAFLNLLPLLTSLPVLGFRSVHWLCWNGIDTMLPFFHPESTHYLCHHGGLLPCSMQTQEAGQWLL